MDHLGMYTTPVSSTSSEFRICKCSNTLSSKFFTIAKWFIFKSLCTTWFLTIQMFSRISSRLCAWYFARHVGRHVESFMSGWHVSQFVEVSGFLKPNFKTHHLKKLGFDSLVIHVWKIHIWDDHKCVVHRRKHILRENQDIGFVLYT